MPIVTSFIPPHPITNGISALCYRSGCSLTIVGNAFSVVSSNDTSEPFSTPLVCVAELEKGRICAIGSYEMFRDRIGGGFNNEEHPNFAYNWLVSDYRMELHSSGAITEIIPQEIINPPQSPGLMAVSPNSSNVTLNIPSSIPNNISKSDLIEMLKSLQNQINTIKATVDKLYDITMALKNDSENNTSHYPTLNQSSALDPVSATRKSSFTPGIDDLLESTKKLSELPPKPESFKKTEEDLTIGLPPIDSPSDLKSPPKLKFKKKSKKDDLLKEKEGLEEKMNSVKSLINFMYKKLKAGDIDKKSYEKRINQLKSDLKKAQSRIEEINKEL